MPSVLDSHNQVRRDDWYYRDPVLDKRDKDLLKSWRDLLYDIPALLPHIELSQEAIFAWEGICDQLHCVCRYHFQHFYEDIEELYRHRREYLPNTPLEHPLLQLIEKVYELMTVDYNNFVDFHDAIINEYRLKSLKKANKKLAEEFEQAKRMCPLVCPHCRQYVAPVLKKPRLN